MLALGCAPMQEPSRGQVIRLGVVDNKQLREISGIVASRRHPGVLWVHNDGKDNRLFAVSTNGQLLSSFEVQAPTDDFEDIAIGPGGTAAPEIYLGDIGDNERTRPTVQVLRLAEPEISSQSRPKNPVPVQPLAVVTLRYPDRPQDAEALLVDPATGDLFIVTKLKRSARVYMAPGAQVTNQSARVTLTFVTELFLGEISAGDISPDGSRIILRREDAAWLWTRQPGENLARTFSRAPKPAALVGPPAEPNGESVTFNLDSRGYFTLSEGRKQPIYMFTAQTAR